jgi:esterase/lipase superfamily enzyme
LGRAIVTVPRKRKVGQVPRPSYWDVLTLTNPFQEDQARHFTIPKDGVVTYRTEAMLFKDVTEHMGTLKTIRDQAYDFVHGYKTSFDAGLYRTAQLTYDLGTDGPFGTAFLFSWPSGGEALDYVYDLESARLAVPHLRAFLNQIFASGKFKNIHLIAHSMGNFPMLKVIEDFAPKDKPMINQVILAAPDVDVTEFSDIAKKIVGKAQGITLYASSNDWAMKASRASRKDTPRAGDVSADGPVVVEGLDTLDSSALSTDMFALNHSDYAERKELLNDVYRLLTNGERPPHKRNINWKQGMKKNIVYWRYAD